MVKTLYIFHSSLIIKTEGDVFMEKVLLYYRFSVFGNFASLQSRISEIAKKIPSNFTRNLGNLQSGFVNDSFYSFTNDSSNIVLSSGRIDFSFSSEDVDLEILKTYFDYLDLKSVTVQRIAINYAKCITDENGEIKSRIFKKIKFFDSSESEPKDVSIRENSIFTYKQISFNDLINVESTILQKKADFTQVPGIAISLDLNSVPTQVSSFAISDLKDFFVYLKDRAITQMNQIMKYCNDDEKENS